MSETKWIAIERAENGGYLLSGHGRRLIAACNTFGEVLGHLREFFATDSPEVEPTLDRARVLERIGKDAGMFVEKPTTGLPDPAFEGHSAT